MKDKEWHKLAEQLNTESFISALTLLDQYDLLGVPHDDKGVLLHGEVEL